MLEDLGQGNKHSEALLQSDVLGEGLSNHSSDNNQTLSGRFWSDELDNTLRDLQQFETKQKVEELLKTVQNSKPGPIESVRTDQELQRILNRETVAEKLSGLLKRNPEIIDCGFDEAFKRQDKAEQDESIRRLNKIDLGPYFLMQLDNRLQSYFARKR